ncbi:heparinase II/III family protein [Aeoliella sp. ICT_H6.2]|uniref:Heparinase II/III family protein n=1 Tax=Aeoliella straminimaris TaxID=2954799 RepID=A0A9X2JJK0_9BACT|nr:heparinase II/III family protein [Aeoliella straminimaris]MCO6045074.1 heparinase II/III family protein [Aeoliella straminimaris]
MSVARCSMVALVVALLLAPRTQAQGDPLATLRPEHPRLLITADDFEQLSERRASDPELDAMLSQIVEAADSSLDAPLLERKMTGRRLLSISRQARDRITQWAMAYRLTGDERFAKRAEEEMLNVCEFSDWNPSHFLDVGEMAAAVGLGYDWLYDQLPADSRQRIREGLRDKAVALIENDYWWQRTTNNWNSVCYGGMAIGALAIAEDEPELARRVVEMAVANNPRALREYEPDGVYPEGPGYWNYGTTYQVLLIDTLRTALGDDLGLCTPALESSGAFVAHATGPTGKTFNFSDGGDRVGAPTALFWIANEANTPAWAKATARLTSSRKRKRSSAFDPLWRSPSPESGEPLALSWRGRGHQPVAMFRTSWTDPNAMFLAAKGGRASTNHGHMDAGSFIFEADGVRWAVDLGGVNYNTYEQKGINIWDRKQGGERWKMYRYGNWTHNTLTVNDKEHNVDGFAELTNYAPLIEDRGELEVDLSKVLPDVQQASRQFVFDAANRQVTINDQLEGVKPGAEIRWTLVTRAKVDIDGNHVTLAQDGKQLAVTLDSKTSGSWTATPYDPPEGFFGEPLKGVTVLTWNAEAPESGACEMTVTLKPAS